MALLHRAVPTSSNNRCRTGAVALILDVMSQPDTSPDLTHTESAGGETDYDVAVIGGGAAGLSAAMVLHTRRGVLVIDAGHPGSLRR